MNTDKHGPGRGLVGLLIIVGLAAGFGGGAAIGWWFPLRSPQTTPDALDPMWQSDYILMTAQAYSLDGDLATAQQRLDALGLADPGARVAARGQEAIAEGLPLEDVGRLARLAAALGTRLPELEPYLTH